MSISRLPKLVRFMSLHAAIGFALATIFTAALILGDPGGIGTLLSQSDIWPVPTLLLWFMLGLTTSSCQMGAAIMLLSDEDDNRSGGYRLRFPSLSRMQGRTSDRVYAVVKRSSRHND